MPGMLSTCQQAARCLRLAVALTSLLGAACQAAGPSVTISRLGFTDDVSAPLYGPAFYLKGDGSPEMASFTEYLRRLSDAPLDVVVLGASYREWEGECRQLAALSQVNSCTTVVIRDPADTADPEVLEALKQAEVIYFRGGDQCNFMRWRDTPIPAAVRALVQRGGGTGGGSAGLAIQGSLAIYDGCRGSVNSSSALADPYRPNVSLSEGLFAWPGMDNIVTDSHFVKRDRMGRLMAILCRQLGSGRTEDAWGLGVNEGAAVVIDRDGLGTVHGGPVFVLQADRPGYGCRVEDEPVNYAGYKIWRLEPGQHYDFTQRPQTGFYRVDVERGVLGADPYVEPVTAAAMAARRTADRIGGF